MNEDKAQYRVQVIERAIGMIELLWKNGPELSQTELASKLGLHKSTVFRILTVLENHRFVEKDLKNGKYIVLTGHDDTIRSLAFSPHGKVLNSASADETIKVWDVANGENIATLKVVGWEVSPAAFGPSGGTFASATQDQRIALWDIPDVQMEQ